MAERESHSRRARSDLSAQGARRTGAIALCVMTLLVLAGKPALAHHAMGGELPHTAWQALVSGLAHPVIGPDHLAFIVGVGLLAGLAGSLLLVPLAFVGGTLAGAVLHLAGIGIPFAELATGATLLALALALFLRASGSAPLLALLLAGGGLLHGYVYAESIIGAEPGPLYAYLLGFSLIQSAIAIGVAIAVSTLTDRSVRYGLIARHSAGVVIGLVAVATMTGLL